MITLNDYLYDGDTVLKILHNYESDLRKAADSAASSCSRMDAVHADYLRGVIDILEHNEFLTSQSQRIRNFYKYMTEVYPEMAFTFKGRIKSLIRSEEKFNRNLIELTEKRYDPSLDYSLPENLKELEEYLADQLMDVRDLIAYRIVVSLPACHLPRGANKRDLEISALYDVAKKMPGFLSKQHFTPEESSFAASHPSERIDPRAAQYYKDFIAWPTATGYQSLHIGFYDEYAGCRFEIQLRTKEMDDFAEIGLASHTNYEEHQKKEPKDRIFPKGLLPFYDEAYQRLDLLQTLDLSSVDVNMFAAVNNTLMNDGCGFFRGRLILPYEHLSRFQNDLIE